MTKFGNYALGLFIGVVIGSLPPIPISYTICMLIVGILFFLMSYLEVKK